MAGKTDDLRAKVFDIMQITLSVAADRTKGVVKEEDEDKGVVKEEDKAMREMITRTNLVAQTFHDSIQIRENVQ